MEVVIWTTTPWTIPCNRALAFNSNYEYSLVEVTQHGEKDTIVLATKLISEVMNSCEIEILKLSNHF